jgi:hypothetical protein
VKARLQYEQAAIDRKLGGLRAERDAVQAQIQAGGELLASLKAQSEQIASVAPQGCATKLQAAQKRDEVTTAMSVTSV